MRQKINEKKKKKAKTKRKHHHHESIWEDSRLILPNKYMNMHRIVHGSRFL